MLIFRRTTGYERTLVTCVLNSHLKRVPIPDVVLIQFCPPEDEHNIARNMYRDIINVLI
jgi:hypothetical protein